MTAKKIFVLATDYPNNHGEKKLMYIHVRNRYYLKEGFFVVVLNFTSHNNYVIDGIEVITLDYYKSHISEYKSYLLLSHASNLRNHYLFLKRYKNNFSRVIFFFHGHEVMKMSVDYPEPYDYVKGKSYFVKKSIRDVYDGIKLIIWREYYKKVFPESDFVFVSNYLLNKFNHNLNLRFTPSNNVHIINNSVSEIFENKDYDPTVEKKYDFITIRSNLDSSTYCIDIINELARNYPNYKFLIIGKGKYFKYRKKADNVLLVNEHLSHKDMIGFIDSSKYALMLTRNDTQGVMSCELATFGIPLITSNIEVCKEIFDSFENVQLIDNVAPDLDKATANFKNDKKYCKNEKYFYKNTVKKEIDLVKLRMEL